MRSFDMSPFLREQARVFAKFLRSPRRASNPLRAFVFAIGTPRPSKVSNGARPAADEPSRRLEFTTRWCR
jgi:hypothetical protein